MRKHLETYYFKVDVGSVDFSEPDKCEKAFRRFIADKLASYFPLTCEGGTDGKGNAAYKIYKIDCDKIFGSELGKDECKD